MSVAAASLLSACAAWQPLGEKENVASADSDAQPTVALAASKVTPTRVTAATPAVELSPQLLYQFLLAEIAGQRGNLQLAIGAYSQLTESTRDARVAKRATEMAMFAREFEAALTNAQLWANADPDAEQAQLTVANLMVATGKTAEAHRYAAKMLALAPPDKLPTALLQLNAIYGRSQEAAVALRDINALTAPYLSKAEAHFARAVAALRVNAKEEASAAIAQALQKKPDWEQAALLQVEIAGGGVQALEGLRQFVEQNPKAFDVRLVFARILFAAGRVEEARQEFTAMQKLQPDNVDLKHAVAVLTLSVKDYAAAKAQFAVLAESQNELVQRSAIYYLGEIAEMEKLPDVALTWYRKIDSSKYLVLARKRMAAILSNAGKLDEAVALLRQTEAERIDEDERAQLMLARAQLLRDAGRSAEAYAGLQSALLQMPQQADLLYSAIMAADEVNKLPDAERYFHQLIQMRPDFAHAYNAFAYALIERNIRLDEAERWLDKALQLAPNDHYILDSKGWLLYRQGRLDEAATILKKALTIRADPDIAAHYGEVLWKLDQPEAARKVWQEALRANPGNSGLETTIKKFLP